MPRSPRSSDVPIWSPEVVAVLDPALVAKKKLYDLGVLEAAALPPLFAGESYSISYSPITF